MKSLVALVALVLGSGLALTAAEPSLEAAPLKPLNYFIVVTGGELLEGVYPDGHTPFLTRALRPLGCQCVGSITVDDNREDIQRAMRFATKRAPLVIVTGGLGPTPNDITRQTLSEFTGISLREHSDVLTQMEKRLNQSRDQLRPNLRQQTQVPTQGGYLKNSNGTAVGLIFDSGSSVIVALPGPPRELQPMVRAELLPYLRAHFGVRNFGCALTLRFVGAGQSLIDQTIKDHVAIAADVVITSLFEGSRVDFTFSLPGDAAADHERLKRLEGAIREHLAQYIYSSNGATLEEVVLQKLQARGGSLVLAEIGSGGSLAAALSAAKGSAPLLTAAYVALEPSAMAKLLNLGAEPLPGAAVDLTKQLAGAAAAQAAGAWTIAVGPLHADAQGSDGVWVALRFPDGHSQTERFPLRDSGEITRTTLTTQVLDFVRRHL